MTVGVLIFVKGVPVVAHSLGMNQDVEFVDVKSQVRNPHCLGLLLHCILSCNLVRFLLLNSEGGVRKVPMTGY